MRTPSISSTALSASLSSSSTSLLTARLCGIGAGDRVRALGDACARQHDVQKGPSRSLTVASSAALRRNGMSMRTPPRVADVAAVMTAGARDRTLDDDDDDDVLAYDADAGTYGVLNALTGAVRVAVTGAGVLVAPGVVRTDARAGVGVNCTAAARARDVVVVTSSSTNTLKSVDEAGGGGRGRGDLRHTIVVSVRDVTQSRLQFSTARAQL
jgi:hypothetical protein